MVLRNKGLRICGGGWIYFMSEHGSDKRACMVDIVALFLSDFGRPKVQAQIALRGANKRFNLV